MKIIYKFMIPMDSDRGHGDIFQFRVPSGAEFLDIAIQDGNIAFWMETNLIEKGGTTKVQDVSVTLRWTGQPYEPNPDEFYIGTVQMGALVWHAFGYTAR